MTVPVRIQHGPAFKQKAGPFCSLLYELLFRFALIFAENVAEIVDDGIINRVNSSVTTVEMIIPLIMVTTNITHHLIAVPQPPVPWEPWPGW